MDKDEVLFTEMKEALKRLQSRAEHFADHPHPMVSRRAHHITEYCDDIRDTIGLIEAEVK